MRAAQFSLVSSFTDAFVLHLSTLAWSFEHNSPPRTFALLIFFFLHLEMTCLFSSLLLPVPRGASEHNLQSGLCE